jgi:hypothetical protein
VKGEEQGGGRRLGGAAGRRGLGGAAKGEEQGAGRRSGDVAGSGAGHRGAARRRGPRGRHGCSGGRRGGGTSGGRRGAGERNRRERDWKGRRNVAWALMS